MNIYFSGTITKDSSLKDNYKHIIKYLESFGHTVFHYRSESLAPEIVSKQTPEEIKESFKQLNSYIKRCDAYIADITIPSVGIGYEIAQILEMKKLALVLKYDRAEFEPLSTLQGNDSQFLRYKKYNTYSLEKIIDLFLSDVQDKMTSKFNLIISPELDRYLEFIAKNKKRPKSKFTRDAIKYFLENDEEYKNFLQNNRE